MQSDDNNFDARLRDAILAEPIDTTALDARVRRGIADSRRIQQRINRGKWIAAIGIAAMLAIVAGGYWLLPNRGAMALCADAARDHRVEVVEHARRSWLTEPAAIDAMAIRQGLRTPAEAIAPAGYRLERGKLCRLGGRVFLHLVYSDGTHEFSFYLRDRGLSGPAVQADLSSAYVAQVESTRYTALVVSNESHAAARDISRFASSRL